MKAFKMKNKGFGLLEVLVSMTLLMTALLFIMGVLTYSWEEVRRTRQRLALNLALEAEQHRLSSLTYDNPELTSGQYSRKAFSKETGPVLWDYRICEPTTRLKQIVLTLQAENWRRQVHFIKSKFVLEVHHD